MSRIGIPAFEEGPRADHPIEDAAPTFLEGQGALSTLDLGAFCSAARAHSPQAKGTGHGTTIGATMLIVDVQGADARATEGQDLVAISTIHPGQQGIGTTASDIAPEIYRGES